MKIDQNIRSGITFGLIGGLLTFLFVNVWTVAVVGAVMGLGLGLGIGPRFPRKDPLRIAIKTLPAAVVATLILIGLNLYQNNVLLEAIGKHAFPFQKVLNANLYAAIGVIVLGVLMSASHGLPEKQERIFRGVILALVVVSFPFVDKFTALRWTAQIIFALIFVILGLGLNIVVGYAGLLDLGYAAFFAIGAYTTGILSSPQHDIFMNFWLVIWIAAAAGAISGLILGAPTLPLRGDYLAIVTLGFGEIIPVVFRNLIEVTIKDPLTCWILPGILRIFGANPGNIACYIFPWFGGKQFVNIDLTAGEKGINPVGRPWFPFIGQLPKSLETVHGQLQLGPNRWLYIGEFQSDNPVTWYFLIIALILLSVFIIRRLHNSRLGRAWMAIREDELAAAQMGIDPVRTKLLAFSMGATFSGFAGAFYAAYIRGIFPSVFDFSASIIILCCVILGGIGNINGVIVGGLALMTADRLFLPALKDFLKGLMDHTVLPALSGNHALQAAVAQNANPILYRFLLFGLTLVIMMSVRPEGLIPSTQRRMELHTEEEMAGEPATAK